MRKSAPFLLLSKKLNGTVLTRLCTVQIHAEQEESENTSPCSKLFSSVDAGLSRKSYFSVEVEVFFGLYHFKATGEESHD